MYSNYITISTVYNNTLQHLLHLHDLLLYSYSLIELTLEAFRYMDQESKITGRIRCRVLKKKQQLN